MPWRAVRSGLFFFFFSSRRRHTRFDCDWSSDVCSSDLFTVRNIGTDFKRHDLGPNFRERNYDGTVRAKIKTPELWGVGSTGAYGHDGRSINLPEVILRHGGEAQRERDAFAALSPAVQGTVLDFLNSLIIFSAPSPASNLDRGDRAIPRFPQVGHGSIRLQTLFNDREDRE